MNAPANTPKASTHDIAAFLTVLAQHNEGREDNVASLKRRRIAAAKTARKSQKAAEIRQMRSMLETLCEGIPKKPSGADSEDNPITLWAKMIELRNALFKKRKAQRNKAYQEAQAALREIERKKVARRTSHTFLSRNATRKSVFLDESSLSIADTRSQPPQKPVYTVSPHWLCGKVASPDQNAQLEMSLASADKNGVLSGGKNVHVLLCFRILDKSALSKKHPLTPVLNKIPDSFNKEEQELLLFIIECRGDTYVFYTTNDFSFIPSHLRSVCFGTLNRLDTVQALGLQEVAEAAKKSETKVLQKQASKEEMAQKKADVKSLNTAHHHAFYLSLKWMLHTLLKLCRKIIRGTKKWVQRQARKLKLRKPEKIVSQPEWLSDTQPSTPGLGG